MLAKTALWSILSTHIHHDSVSVFGHDHQRRESGTVLRVDVGVVRVLETQQQRQARHAAARCHVNQQVTAVVLAGIHVKIKSLWEEDKRKYSIIKIKKERDYSLVVY